MILLRKKWVMLCPSCLFNIVVVNNVIVKAVTAVKVMKAESLITLGGKNFVLK